MTPEALKFEACTLKFRMRLEGMITENYQRARRRLSIAYAEDAFTKLERDYETALRELT